MFLCISLVVVKNLALLAVENLVLLLASGMRNRVHETYESLFDIGSLLGSFIKCHSQSILILVFVTICMVFGWACIAIFWVYVTLFVFSPPSMEFETSINRKV